MCAGTRRRQRSDCERGVLGVATRRGSTAEDEATTALNVSKPKPRANTLRMAPIFGVARCGLLMLGLSSFFVAQLTAFPGGIGHQSWPDAPTPVTLRNLTASQSNT